MRRLGGSRLELIDAGALLALCAMALWAFESSYGGITFFVVGFVGVVLGALVAHLSHKLPVPWPLAALIVVVVYVLVAPAMVLSYYTANGFLPTVTSVVESLTIVVEGWKQLITTVPPVGATGDLLALPIATGLATGFAGMLLSRRIRPTLPAAIPAFLMLCLAIAVGTRSPVSIALHGAAMVLVLVAWMAWREHERRPLIGGSRIDTQRLAFAALVLIIGAVAGYVVGPNLPGAESSNRDIWRETVTPPFDPRQYPSPLSSYRAYVKPGYDDQEVRLDSKVMFTVEGLPEGIPIRLSTMDTYDGLTWQVSAGEIGSPSLVDSGSFERVGNQVDPEWPGEIAEVIITIREYSDVWIPDVGEVISMRFNGSSAGPERDRELANSFRYNRSTDAAATVVRLGPGDRYEMTVRLPALLEELAEVTFLPAIARLGRHRSVAEITQAMATADVLAINDPGRQLERVREIMLEGAYSDGDTDSGQVRARAGHSAGRLVDFAGAFPRRPLRGNAEQYASTFALLTRDLNRLPARVVMGFIPPEESTAGPIEVLGTDVEAWVELPVDDIGWVGIFPTPPRDQLAATSTAPQQPEPDYRTRNPPPPPVLDPEFDQPAKASGDAKPPEDPDAIEESGGDTEPTGTPPLEEPVVSRETIRVVAIAASPVMMLLLFGALIALVKLLRRTYRRRRGEPHEKIANGWLEISDLATDLGRPVPPLVTRQEAAQFVGDDEAIGLARRLAKLTDQRIWSGQELTDVEVSHYWDGLKETRTAIKRGAGVYPRVRAVGSVQSLKRKRTGAKQRDQVTV